MKYFKVKFYDSDHGGMRTELTKVINFRGTWEEVVALIEGTLSPWGFYYKVNDIPCHGSAVVQEVNENIYKTEIELEMVQAKLDQLYWELGRKW
ncbi:MAG: hypothetical protein C0610_11055 [Desulfobacteraceae bacterium]|nr:MAG: hypothetical protein C0610_11055 [Desulfobacteraceae bacterium]